MHMEFIHRKYQGMSLVELLIALALSVMLSSMMIHAFLVIKKSVLTQQALERLKVNARSIDYLLGKAIRNSGAMGCQRLGRDLLISGLTQPYGVKGVMPSDLKKAAGGKRVLQRAVLQSDLLWLQSAEPLALNQRPLKPGTLLVHSDCQRVIFFRWNGSSPNEMLYSSTMKRLASTVYYVGKSQHINAKGDPIYALYSTDFNGRTLELVEGVEKLEFTYGTWKNGQFVYQKAEEVEDWFALVSVRLKALLNSVEENDPIVKKWWSFEWPLMVSN